jgi:outer membrane immunogenic protein
MKRFLGLAAAFAMVSGTAIAADIPVYEEPPPVTPYIPTWSGFYAGLHGGYGWGDGIICPAAILGIDLNGDGICECPEDGPFVVSGDDEGAVIGGQIGVNWQMNMFVLGAEGDASWVGFDDDGLEWLASIRGRTGVGFDRFLIYGTGGAAFGGFDDLGGDDDLEVGWVGGGGGEFLLTEHVSLGAEYLHYEFDPDDPGDFSVDVIRGRVNFKFGGLGQ